MDRTQTLTTDYRAFVLDVFKRAKPVGDEKKTQSEKKTTIGSNSTPPINQAILRECLGLSSSFLITDLTTNPSTEKGMHTWLTGFTSLVDVVVALHSYGELELETINAASQACSECWMAAGSWRGLEDCRDGVRIVAGKLKKLLDVGGKTYLGEPVYAP